MRKWLPIILIGVLVLIATASALVLLIAQNHDKHGDPVSPEIESDKFQEQASILLSILDGSYVLRIEHNGDAVVIDHTSSDAQEVEAELRSSLADGDVSGATFTQPYPDYCSVLVESRDGNTIRIETGTDVLLIGGVLVEFDGRIVYVAYRDARLARDVR